jgi:hypothetical protein
MLEANRIYQASQLTMGFLDIHMMIKFSCLCLAKWVTTCLTKTKLLYTKKIFGLSSNVCGLCTFPFFVSKCSSSTRTSLVTTCGQDLLWTLIFTQISQLSIKVQIRLPTAHWCTKEATLTLSFPMSNYGSYVNSLRSFMLTVRSK